ncbi:hypothetical protein ACWE42_15480 [Sutcliffiella cohnii]
MGLQLERGIKSIFSLKSCFLLIILITTGCNITKGNITVYKEPSNLNTEMYYSLGMFHESSVDELETYYEIMGNSNTFTPELMIDNQIDKAYTYRIFLFKNYKQQLITYEEENYSFLDLKLEPFETKKINISLSIEEGANDILVVSIRDPERILEHEEYVDPIGIYALRRAVVINQSKPIYPFNTSNLFKNINVSEKNSKESTGTIAPHILLEGVEGIQTLIPSSYKGKLIMRMESDKPSRYALVSILGDKVKLLENQFFQVKKAGLLEVDIADLPLSNKQSENLIIAVIENPYSLSSEEIAQSNNRFVNVITLQGK